MSKIASQFRKRPVVIEAVQLTPENGALVWEWADSKPFYEPDGTISGLTISTLEGRMKADFGDWIIRGVKGEFYPCKPDIFEATYEPADGGRKAPDGAPWYAHLDGPCSPECAGPTGDGPS